MKRASTLALILLMISVSPLAAAEITFDPTDVAAGETWTETGSYGSNVTVTRSDSVQTFPAATQITSVTRTKVMKILAVGGDSRIDSLEVSYSAASLPDVVGKTYLLTVQGQKVDAVTYKDPANGSPSAAEEAFVKKDNSHFGQFRALNRIFRGNSTFTTGQSPRKINKNDAAELVNASGDMAVDDLDLTLADVIGSGDDQVAVFDVVLKLKGSIKSKPKQGDETLIAEKFAGDVLMDLTGTLRVKVNCRPAGLNLNGTHTMRATRFAPGPPERGRDKMTVNADGTTTLNFSYSGYAF